MKNTHRVVNGIVISILAIVLNGCLKDNSQTIILPTEVEESIAAGRVPDTIIPPAIREEFEEVMTIHTGKTPPNIVGEFLVTPCLLVYTSDGELEHGHQFADDYFAFAKDAQTGNLVYQERQAGSESYANKVYLIGNDNNFTAYFTTYGEYDDGVTTYKMSTLISGTLTDYGVSNYQYAFIMLDKYDPNSRLMDINEYRVIEDGDGLAESYKWTSSLVPAPASSSTTLPLLIETIKKNHVIK